MKKDRKERAVAEGGVRSRSFMYMYDNIMTQSQSI